MGMAWGRSRRAAFTCVMSATPERILTRRGARLLLGALARRLAVFLELFAIYCPPSPPPAAPPAPGAPPEAVAPASASSSPRRRRTVDVVARAQPLQSDVA